MSKSAEIHTGSLVLAVLLMVSTGASAETLTDTVVGVADGDTITVLDANHEQHKIRVAGIDAPEKAQPFGQRSKESLSAMVFGKAVDVLWHKHDRYQRIVGKVMVASPDCRATTCPRTLDAGWTRPWQYEKQRGTQACSRSERATMSRSVHFRIAVFSKALPAVGPSWLALLSSDPQ